MSDNGFLNDDLLADEDENPREPDRGEALPQPVEAPFTPNIDLAVFRAEVAALADIGAEALLKGLILEAREIARGCANIIANPDYAGHHADTMRLFEAAAGMGVRLAETVAKLQAPPPKKEHHQLIRVEKIEIAPPGRGEGVLAVAKNE